MVFRKTKVKAKFYICTTNRSYESLQYQTFPENPFQPS
jgi:hypothetical protein